jgi:hypothetical protein
MGCCCGCVAGWPDREAAYWSAVGMPKVPPDAARPNGLGVALSEKPVLLVLLMLQRGRSLEEWRGKQKVYFFLKKTKKEVYAHLHAIAVL